MNSTVISTKTMNTNQDRAKQVVTSDHHTWKSVEYHHCQPPIVPIMEAAPISITKTLTRQVKVTKIYGNSDMTTQ